MDQTSWTFVVLNQPLISNGFGPVTQR